jgi:DNA segregation ATPase FtsK/SpoIIIE, S-DNA-T family
VRVITPTENRRFNELIGFVGLSIAVLLALSLLSYSPLDPSFNVAAGLPGAVPSRNWIGPVGAHLADLFFQGVGWSAFLVPIGIFALAMRWFRSQTIESPVAKLVGSALLILSVTAELTLIHMPPVRGAIPAGGLLGTVLAEGVRMGFGAVGANLVSLATLLTALFLATSFSFHAAAHWIKKPLAEEGIIGGWLAQAREWREAREAEGLRKKVENIKIAGRPPVAQQRVSTREVDEEEDEDSEPAPSERGATVIKFHDQEDRKRTQGFAREDQLQATSQLAASSRRAQRENGRGRAERMRPGH